MRIGLFEQQMTRIIPSFAGFTEFTSSIPKLYWDVKSQEQRILAICKMLDKVICYADMLGENVDEIAHTMQEILDGKLDPMIVEAIAQWFEDNEPEILQDIDAINTKIGSGFDAENTVADAIASTNEIIGSGFDAQNTVAGAIASTNEIIGSGFDAQNTVANAIASTNDALNQVVSDVQDVIGTILDESPLTIQSVFDREARKAFFLVKIQRSFFDIDVINNDGTYSNGDANTDVYAYMLNYGCKIGKAIAFNCDYFPSKMVLHDQYYGSTDLVNVRSYFAVNTNTGDIAVYPVNTSFSSIQNDGYNCIFGTSYIWRQNGIDTVPVPLDGYYAPRNIIGWNDDYIWFMVSHGRDFSAFGVDGNDVMNVFNKYTEAKNIVNLDGGGSVQCVMNMDGTPFMITQYADGDNDNRNVPLNINFKRKAQ